MTKQITLEEALKLVTFKHAGAWGWQVSDVHGDVTGDIHGTVGRNIFGTVGGNIYGGVNDHVWGKINGRHWESVETPKENCRRTS